MSYKLTASVLSALVIAAPAQSEESTGLPITVTATRFKQSTASDTASVTVVTKEQIERHGWQTVSDVLKNQPSLELRSNGGKGQLTTVFMRGFNPAQTLVLIDGMRLSRSSMESTDISVIPLNNIERIEIIRGARASIYGADAVAGVINIITRSETNNKSLKLSSDVGSYGYTSTNVVGQNAITDNDHIKLAGGYSREDGFNVLPMSGVNDNDEHGYWNKNALVNYQHNFDSDWQLFSSARLNQKQYAYANSYTGKYTQGFIQDQAYQTSLEKSNENLQTSFVVQYDDMDYLSGFSKGETKDDATYKSYTDQTTLGWYNLIPINNNWSFGGGIDWQLSRLKPDSAFEAQTHNTGEYILSQFSQDKWTWELSARNDDNSAYSSHQTWRTGAGWSFRPGYKLSTNYGTAFRAPNFVDLYYPDYGNPNLKPEEAKGGEIGLSGEHELFQWKINAYRSLVNNMIVLNKTTWIPENIDYVRLQGIETELNFVTGYVRHHLSADFTDPENLSSGHQLRERAKRSYKWQAETSWRNFDGSIAWVYQGRRFADDDNTVMLGGYSTWDVTVGYHLSPAFRVAGRVDNIFDKNYEIVQKYATAGRTYYLSLSYEM